jgi:hypothetical protein
MDFIIIIIVLVVLFVVGAVVRRRRKRARTMDDSGATTTAVESVLSTDRLSNTFSQARSSVQNVWAKRPWVSTRDLAPQMQQWIKRAFQDQPDIQQWLATLSEQQTHDLADQLVTFCLNLNIDPAWLVNDQLDRDARLKQAVTAIVTTYGQTLWQAVQLQPDIQTMHAWQAFDENPYGKQQQAFAQKIVVKLVEKGLTPALSPNLLLAAEPERQIYGVQAIRQAAEKQPEAFQAVLKEVVATMDTNPGEDSAANVQHKPRWFRRVAANTTA